MSLETSRTNTEGAARIERLFLIAMIPALLYLVVSLYIRVTNDADPLWTEFATPLFLGLIGLRAVVLPGAPEARNPRRAVGYLLLLATLVLVALILYNSQGAL